MAIFVSFEIFLEPQMTRWSGKNGQKLQFLAVLKSVYQKLLENTQSRLNFS